MRGYAALTGWIGDKPFFRPIARRLLPKIDRALLRRWGVRATPFPTLLLTTVGYQSGRERHTPLFYLEDGGYVVIASNFGGDEPVWSRHLTADPVCRITIGRRPVAAHAQRVSDEDWPQHFDRFAAFYPPYRDYVRRAGREIPMWRLIPIPATA